MNMLVRTKKLRFGALLMFTSLAGSATAPALAQIQPMGAAPATAAPAQPKGAARVAPDAPVPGNPDFRADQSQAAPAPPPLPPAIWDVPSALELVSYIQQVGGDGLNPADYDPAGLQAAIQSGNPMVISPAATQRFNQLSSDLALGHVKKPGGSTGGSPIPTSTPRGRTRCFESSLPSMI